LFDIGKKKQNDNQPDPYAETYFQELQFIDHRKKHWSKQNEEDPLQVVVFGVLIPIFLASISTTIIIILSMFFE
jgi:hypothetical protein